MTGSCSLCCEMTLLTFSRQRPSKALSIAFCSIGFEVALYVEFAYLLKGSHGGAVEEYACRADEFAIVGEPHFSFILSDLEEFF